MEAAYFSSTGTAKNKLDIVKSFGTKARIFGVEWVADPVTLVMDADIRMLFGFCIQDFETAKTPTGPWHIWQNRYVRSTFGIYVDILAGGGASGFVINKYIDLTPMKIEVVCPVTLLGYASAGGGIQIVCRVYYEVLRASQSEIVKIAAEQGLNLEV